MSSCVAKRWAGMGTTREKPTNASLSKEVNDKLIDMQTERAKQDSFLFGQTTSQELVVSNKPPIRIEIPVFRPPNIENDSVAAAREASKNKFRAPQSGAVPNHV